MFIDHGEGKLRKINSSSISWTSFLFLAYILIPFSTIYVFALLKITFLTTVEMNFQRQLSTVVISNDFKSETRFMTIHERIIIKNFLQRLLTYNRLKKYIF